MDVIVTATTPVTKSAKNVTRTIPIVMTGNGIPVEEGLVQSLAHPGGNVTGLTLDTGPEIAGKKLELLRELIPGLSRLAVLRDIEQPDQARQGMEAISRTLGIKLLMAEHAPIDFADAFALIARERPDALYVAATAAAYVARHSIVEFAVKSKLPTMYPTREYVAAGGLISYGVDVRDLFRRAAGYVDRILRGTNPADLPVEQPTKTAKTLGLTVPPGLLARADEVIE